MRRVLVAIVFICALPPTWAEQLPPSADAPALIIRGIVTAQNDAVLPRVRVVARVVARRVLDETNKETGGAIEYQADADDLGDYRIGGIPEGRYSVAPLPSPANNRPGTVPPPPAADAATVTVRAGAGEWQEAEFLQMLSARATRVTLGGGQSHHVNLRVINR